MSSRTGEVHTPRVNQVFGSDWWPITVKGKDNVLGLKAALEKNKAYSDDKVSYYVDQDFDSLKNTINLYITPCYSIENLYTSSSVIRHLLHTAAELSEYNNEAVQDAIGFITEKYTNYREIYISSKKIRYMNVFFLYVRKKLQNKKISFDSLFSITHNIGNSYSFTITPKTKLLVLKNQIVIKDFLTFLKADPVAKQILNSQTNIYRGKQELSFVREFVTALKAENSDLNKSIQTATTIKIRFKNNAIGNDLIHDLSSVANTPICLNKFLLDLHAYNQSH